MATGRNSRYDSFEIYVPDDLTQEFITGFGEFGLHVGKVHCFSAKPTSIKEFLNFVYERGKTYAPTVLKALDMLQKKHSIKIEISADRKLFELQGISTEDALKLIEAAQAIKVTHSRNPETSSEETPPVA
ncbi:hypothetical protein UXO30_06155 [Enterobacter bugandensis]|uniref:hypothetical protein n=1 Tax=Enterobacter bugandensis TaxID=881260 RepID=UPI002FD54617